ncbi:hypothetical protein L1987_07948 [Smallanthus sonchifolius]|uniref:Uncharacterized protein n=1 Tax=Smallanthus sonchifolius TaxID=185202 RepID=A0ACB9JJ87_9ASTR|nr:hypothetical protein L1987_07948 [Smallanthus sonchifolius]
MVQKEAAAWGPPNCLGFCHGTLFVLTCWRRSIGLMSGFRNAYYSFDWQRFFIVLQPGNQSATLNMRPDLTAGLKRLQCRSLILVGENSPFNSDSLHMTSKLDRRFSALIEVRGCGSIVTEEQPDAMFDTNGIFPHGLWALPAL